MQRKRTVGRWTIRLALASALLLAGMTAAVSGAAGPEQPGGGNTNGAGDGATKAAFIRNQNLWVKSGGQERQLTEGDKAHKPLWSADGQWIAYLSWAGGHRVTVARAYGSNPRPISEPGAWSYPQWSPDARHVLAVDWRDGGSQPIVAILDPFGTKPVTSFAIPDVSGLGRADFASWQRLALP